MAKKKAAKKPAKKAPKGKSGSKIQTYAKKVTTTPPAFFKAMSHELRQAILGAMFVDGVQSPKELSKLLGEGQSQVSYHVKVLKDCKVITLDKEEPRRGAMEHFYVLTKDMKAWIKSQK